ncbi:protein-L-isoaspartate O-methyltransferase family protein [Salinispira pacifica]|uniref:Protein-L-isoaspartate O-methyltransferase n=1 Tax=Salinispira pacifica TaxID=1307761 RepID=V5WFR5_9SPIO|nr:protein-L-isoaspartate O-methyltransferase [Salinispira pacifica]AHC14662.1 Protein-L-isoaspartate O-methyltransferase [Salinispira pacifica]
MSRTNRQLIRQIYARLESENRPLSARLIRAFELADRRYFVPRSLSPGEIYSDHPIPIGQGQTNSQPFTVAFMLQLLAVEEGNRILDLGSGSGWTTALLSLLCGPSGHVLGMDRVALLLEFARANLREWSEQLGGQTSVSASILSEIKMKIAGFNPGLPGNKFDRILVSASAGQIPDELLNQLASPGIMVIPVGNAIVKIIHSPSGKAHTERYEGFRFVPFIQEQE